MNTNNAEILHLHVTSNNSNFNHHPQYYSWDTRIFLIAHFSQMFSCENCKFNKRDWNIIHTISSLSYLLQYPDVEKAAEIKQKLFNISILNYILFVPISHFCLLVEDYKASPESALLNIVFFVFFK